MKKARQIFWFVILVLTRTPKKSWDVLRAIYDSWKDDWEDAGDM